ncbi:MAG: hypothetical protein D3922_06570 [Candidatus Electrothrix sp. AR1]|nr:hypothetical protein [Candidatus Electrothrix sp. AR1]
MTLPREYNRKFGGEWGIKNRVMRYAQTRQLAHKRNKIRLTTASPAQNRTIRSHVHASTLVIFFQAKAI